MGIYARKLAVSDPWSGWSQISSTSAAGLAIIHPFAAISSSLLPISKRFPSVTSPSARLSFPDSSYWAYLEAFWKSLKPQVL
jgi:hypothetical protein